MVNFYSRELNQSATPSMITPIVYLYSLPLFVALIIAGPLPEELEHNGKIPDCRDGGKPLLAADIGVYTCDKKCPRGFRCEYKTTDTTAKKGICCPNLNELYKIYGRDG